MKISEYNKIAVKMAEVVNTLEDLETNLICKFGEGCPTAAWLKLTSCYMALTILKFTAEYNVRFVDDQGSWLLTE